MLMTFTSTSSWQDCNGNFSLVRKKAVMAALLCMSHTHHWMQNSGAIVRGAALTMRVP